MLSRVADALFWMGRYLERAGCLARAVDVTFHLDLDLHGVLADPVREEWEALLATVRPASPGSADVRPDSSDVARWLLVDPGNPGSVMSCVNRARNNARMIRGSLGSQMWRELNKLYWRLSDPLAQSRVVESPHEFCEDTQLGVMLCHGICETTVARDEGWHFIQLGTFLERAERVLRVLDARLRSPGGNDAADLPVNTLRWVAVLKKCRAYEAYQRSFLGRVEADRVVTFLLLDAEFPQSVRFGLERVLGSLAEIGGSRPGRDDGASMRTVGRLVSTLAYLDADGLDDAALRGFIGDSLARCATIGGLVQRQYSLL